MKKRSVSLVFTILFMAACLLPAAGMALLGPSQPGANEVLSPRPALTDRDGKLNGSVLTDAAAYFGDHFGFRQELITGWAKLNAALFRTSTAEDVILGREGWLYFAPTLGDYTRTDPMTDRELWCAARTLYLLQENARSDGGEFLFVIAPNKNSLYPDAMPLLPVEKADSNARSLFRRLEEMGVDHLDLFSVFRQEEEILYFPTDSHWNGRGAALAADALLTALGREGGYYTAEFLPGEHKGDLYEMLYPAGKETDPDQIYAPGFTFTGGGKNPDAITIRTQSAAGQGSLVMYRDSFGRNLYPYLAERFESAVFSRKTDYGSTELAPGDVLVIELVERNLRYLNQYAPAIPAPVRAAELAEAAQSAGSVRLAAAETERYLSLEGTFSGILPDDDSPVYVLCGNTVYEAVPRPEGFRLCLEKAGTPETIAVIFTSGGNRIALTGVIEYT